MQKIDHKSGKNVEKRVNIDIKYEKIDLKMQKIDQNR